MTPCPTRARIAGSRLFPFHWRVAVVIALVIGLSAVGRGETLTVSRRLVRFDGKPATGAKVRVLSEYGFVTKKTDREIVADADGKFSVVVAEGGSWIGRIIVLADGCATTCELAILPRKSDLREPPPVLRLNALFRIEGNTMDAEGRPIADATVSLVSAQFENYNATAFNSTTTDPTKTPELIAHSAADGKWSMPGIDFVLSGKPTAATVTFEAVADKALRTSKLDLHLDPNPDVKFRKDIPLNLRLTPLIRVAGQVVNSVTGEPVAGAWLARNALYTTLAGSSAQTDAAGRFELRIPGPLRLLWFHVGRNGFATTTVKTAMRVQATGNWPDTNDLAIRIRPIVAVSGRLRDENGKPPDEPLELDANYEERIDALWDQQCSGAASESKVGADGSFNAKVPAGKITVSLRRPPQPMGSMMVYGMSAENFRLDKQVEIPAEGMKGLELNASRINKEK